MSATGQGDAGQGEAQQGEAQDGGQDVTQHLAQISEALANQGASQQELFEYLRQDRAPAQDEQQQQEGSDLDLSFLDDGTGMFDASQMQQRLNEVLSSSIDQRVQQGIQQAVSPLQEQVAEARREQDFAALVGEFPELGEEQTATQVLQMTGQLAEMSGHPELAGEPWLVRLTYMAGRAADAAQQEQGETPAPAHLESGAGAAPAGGSGAMTAEQIVGARRGASVLPFS